MTSPTQPGADGYVEAECRAAEAHGTFAVPRFAPDPNARLTEGWADAMRWMPELADGPEAYGVARRSDLEPQTGSYASEVLSGRQIGDSA